MEVTLLGTGDTTGTPTVGCDCDTCAAAVERGVERTRFSVHVENGDTGETLLVDASPDFHHQFRREGLAPPDAVAITHVHFDHLHGLGNLYRLGRSFPVYASGAPDPVAGESVAETVRDRYHYLDALDVRGVEPGAPVTAAGLEVTFLPVDHPPRACYGLCIREPETGATLAITGDTSWDVPAATREGLAGADLLLVDGIVNEAFCEHHPAGGSHPAEDAEIYRTFGTKHLTVEGARRLAAALDPAQYRIVHVSHYTHPELAFAEDLGVDGDRFSL